VYFDSPEDVIGLAVLPTGGHISCSSEGIVTMQQRRGSDDSSSSSSDEGSNDSDNDDGMDEIEIDAGGPVSAFSLEKSQRSCFAVGGKEMDAELWDIATQTRTFKARNVPHDFLDMRLPVWITALEFLGAEGTSGEGASGGGGNTFVTGTAYKQMRIYDTRAQSRPVQNLNDVSEYRVNALAVTPDQSTIVMGDTAGGMSSFDVRMLKRSGRFVGPAGSIRSLSCHPTAPYIASVGLDRVLRVFDLRTRINTHTVYMKQRLNSVLFTDEPELNGSAAGDGDGGADDDDDEGGAQEYTGLDFSSSEEELDEEDENSCDDDDEEDRKAKRMRRR
jgi:ribosome biogenesis protein NSA1